MKLSPHSEMDEEQAEYREKLENVKEAIQNKKNKEMSEFYEVIAHGDDTHKAWLKGMIEGYFKVKIAR